MFNILAPIFGLIVLAFASRRLNILGPNAYIELNRFVASLALPALIFDRNDGDQFGISSGELTHDPMPSHSLNTVGVPL